MEETTTFMRFLELLRTQPVLTLFLILGVGYLIGNIRIGSTHVNDNAAGLHSV